MSNHGNIEKFDLVTRGQSFVQAQDPESLRALLVAKDKIKVAWGMPTCPLLCTLDLRLICRQRLLRLEDVKSNAPSLTSLFGY